MSVADEAATKLPVPDEAALKDAREEVQKLLASDFRSARSKPEQIALTEKLLKLAEETSGDPVTRYALLVEAEELAARAAHIELAMQAIDARTDLYAVDGSTDRLEVIEQIARRVRSSEDARQLSEVAHQLFRQMVESANYPLSEEVSKIEMRMAVKSRDPIALTEARADDVEIDKLMDRWEEFQNAQQTVQTNAQDADAQTVVGLFLAFDQGDWKKASTHLKASGDSQLVQAVQSELQPPTVATKQVELADLWREIAQPREELDRQFALERSLFWYRKAVDDLTGFSKARVESRIAEFDLPLSETEPLYLINLEEFDVIGGPWGLGKGIKGARSAVPIVLGGKVFKNGLGVHPPSNGFSQVKYRLDGRFGTFVSTVGMGSREGTTSRPVVFVLMGDGKILWKSKPLRNGQSIQTCAGDITGVKVLELRAVCSGGHVNAHACWGDPYVMKARGLAPR